MSRKSSPPLDHTQIDLNVEVTRPNATDAREAGAVATNATLAALTAAGVPPSAITTSGLSLTPKTQTDPNTGATKQVGFTFSEGIEIKLSNVTEATLSNVVDSAVKAAPDAVQVQSVTISLSPTLGTSATNEARKLAVSDALNTANVLSSAASVALGPILTLSDYSSSPPITNARPSTDAMGASAENKTPTPYVIGPFDTTASVGLEIAICRAQVATTQPIIGVTSPQPPIVAASPSTP